MSIIVGLLLVFILLGFFYIWYLKFKLKYTRERFAFVGVTVILALISSLILQVYSSVGYISAIVETSNFLFSTNYSAYQTDFKDHLLMVILILAMMSFIFKIHKNWDGPISESLHERIRFNENQGLLEEAYLQMIDFLSAKKRITLYEPSLKEENQSVFIQNENSKMPWSENVFELLTYSDHQYRIDLKQDYYQKEKCFISKYGNSGKYVAIYCVTAFPKDASIRKFIQFTKNFNYEFTEFIIAIRERKNQIIPDEFSHLNLIIKDEGEMLNALIDFTSYQNFIETSFNLNEISRGGGITLKDIYVPLEGRSYNGNQLGVLSNYIENWLSEKNNKHLALLGEYGCGKSVMSLKLTLDLLLNKSKFDRIPILIELRGQSPRNMDLLQILSSWGASYRIDGLSLLKLHAAGKLLLIFEGFDEMDMAGNMDMRLNHFQKIWQFAIPKSKIIITGRPNFFLDDTELKTNLGIERPYENSHYCEAIYLNKFGINQIKEVLRNVDTITRKQVLEILEKPVNTNFSDLVSRPSILYLVSVIWQERKLSDYKGNINSAVVISEFIQYAYSRQSEKKAQFPLTEKEREYFMLGIAVGMLWQSDFSNQIHKIHLESIILKLYKNFPSDISAIQNATQVPRKNLDERMKNNNHAEETILADVRSCGILVHELSKNNYFKFAHKSFFEYQISLYFVESILQNKSYYNLIMNAITKALGLSINDYKHSKATISFTSEILISRLNKEKLMDHKDLCKELFIILYPNKILGKFPKVVAFYDLLFIKRGITVMIAISLSFLLMIILYISATGVVSKTPFLLISTILVVLQLFFTFNIRSAWRKRRKIWLQCCEQLNISNDIIASVVNEKYIKAIRKSVERPEEYESFVKFLLRSD